MMRVSRYVNRREDFLFYIYFTGTSSFLDHGHCGTSIVGGCLVPVHQANVDLVDLRVQGSDFQVFLAVIEE